MITKTTLEKDIFLLHQVMSPSSCQEIIFQAEQIGFQSAPITTPIGQVMNPSVRNNKRLIDFNTNLSHTLWASIRPFFDHVGLYIPIGLNEMFRIYKYEEGEQFKRHRDGAYERNPYEQSLFTFILYLNDDYQGGKTAFRNFEIDPQPGMALCFRHPILHEGKVVESGTKYALRTDVMYRMREND